jgi:UDP-N-acetylglucosamine 2-epimerase
MKVATIVGTRPNIVKLSALGPEIEKKHTHFVIDTRQHYDYNMDQIFFDELGIRRPDYTLGGCGGNYVCKGGCRLGEMIKRISSILEMIKPAVAVVIGDTDSTLAGALAANKEEIPLIHVEAGLRSYNRRMPEEMNRVIVDNLADKLACPTVNALKNLVTEGNLQKKATVTYDLTLDVILKYHRKANENKILEREELSNIENYYLATIHRKENLESKNRLTEIMKGLKKIAKIEPVILTCHPVLTCKLMEYGLYTEGNEGIIKIEPQGLLAMIHLEKNATKIITDSGGVQKEAYLLNTECITVRNETEWPETLKHGWNTLVNANKNEIANETLKPIIKDDPYDYTRYIDYSFGDGHAAKNTVKMIDKMET